MKHLHEQARALLRENDRGSYTVPSPRLYPHQWAWDSAFAAMGFATFDIERALLEIETLMGAAWDDGRVPHIVFHDLSSAYYPGPSFWGTKNTTSITQPPMWAPALRRILEAGADADRCRALIPGIERSHQFFYEQRDPQKRGTICVAHPWESGLDNAPQWDSALAAIDPDRAQAFRRVDTDIADASERPSDDQYRRYSVIVQDIAASGFGFGGFAVYDPFMTTMLAFAEAELATLAASLGVKSDAAARASALTTAVQELWDPTTGRFCFLDANSGERSSPDVLAASMPLILPGLDADVRERTLARVREEFQAEWPLPTVAPASELFEPRRYWRGPVWINMNWFFASVPELKDSMIEKTLALVEKSGFHEYYDSRTGEGLGGERFTWSAALTLDLLRHAGL